MMTRGEIYWINLDPVMGSEISTEASGPHCTRSVAEGAKTRPGIIVSNNINNEASSTVTVLPITSNTKKIYPFEVLLLKGTGGLLSDSKAKANQIRTVDKRRLGRFIGMVNEPELFKIEQALKLHLDLD